MKKLKTAVFGSGFMGRVHTEGIRRLGNVEVAAIAASSDEKARKFGDEIGVARTTGDYRTLLSDPEIDAIYNPLPNHLHLEWSLRAVQAGKHVLCEKPIGLNAREAEDMAAAASASGKHLMEAFMYRFHPAVRELVARSRRAIHVDASFGFKLRDGGDIRLNAKLGGGALLDVGCYTVSVARWILGEPDQVVARSTMRNGVDMTTSALLRFPGGSTASAWCSVESAEVQEVMVITPGEVLRRTRAFNARHDPDDPYRLMVESFADSVIRDRPVEIPLSESIANMRVLDRIAEASRS